MSALDDLLNINNYDEMPDSGWEWGGYEDDISVVIKQAAAELAQLKDELELITENCLGYFYAQDKLVQEIRKLRAELDKKDTFLSTDMAVMEMQKKALDDANHERAKVEADYQKLLSVAMTQYAALEQMRQYFKQINDALYPYPHTISQIEFGDICDKVDAAWLSAHPAPQGDNNG